VKLLTKYGFDYALRITIELDGEALNQVKKIAEGA
jgi:hypothetical protein